MDINKTKKVFVIVIAALQRLTLYLPDRAKNDLNMQVNANRCKLFSKIESTLL